MNNSTNGLPTTEFENLVALLINVEVTKCNEIHHSNLSRKRDTGSLNANSNQKGSPNRRFNEQKPKHMNSRKKKRVPPDTTEEHTEVEFVPVPIDVYDSLNAEASCTKCVCEELCDTIGLWKENFCQLHYGLNASKLVATCTMTFSSSLPPRCFHTF